MPQQTPGWYTRVVAPRVVHTLCSAQGVQEQRQRVVPRAEGVVLEIGIGTGLNLPHYNVQQIERIVGVDPDGSMLKLGAERIAEFKAPLEVLQASAEELPLESHSVDSVVLTYTLCSIPDPSQALAEIRRVLKPGGRVLFCEHGRAASRRAARWQDRLNSLWRKLALGCNLNRDPQQLLTQAGFRLEEFEQFVLRPMPSFVGTHYLGTATLAAEQ